MSNKKLLLGTVLAAAVCFSACSEQAEEQTGTQSEPVTTASETETAAEEASVTVSGEDGLTSPLAADPESAVKVYLQKLSESENVVSLELRDTSIGQSYSVADKYYESPLAEQFGIEKEMLVVPVGTEYYIEYAEDSALESGEKNEYIVVKCGENGFEVIDSFPCDPKDYCGEVKDILTDSDGDIDFYMVELDGGLGTVKCNNAGFYDKFETGERVRIYGNGDIYGNPPRIDAVSIVPESEASDGG